MVRFLSHQTTPCVPLGDEARWCRKSQARGSQYQEIQRDLQESNPLDPTYPMENVEGFIPWKYGV